MPTGRGISVTPAGPPYVLYANRGFYGIYGVPTRVLSSGSGGSPTETINAAYVTRGPPWALGSLQWIGWDFPIIAYPGIDVNYKFTAFDWFNGTLAWSVVSGPGSINNHGVYSWIPPTDHTTQSVTVQATFTLSGWGSYSVQKTFTIKVESTQCLFVATTGNDANPGTLASPYLNIGKGMAVAAAAMPTTPMAVFVRGGAYSENYGVGSTYPNTTNWAKGGSTSAFMVLRNYPGESPVLDLGTAAGAAGIYLSGTQSVVYGLEIKNGTDHEGGCIVADSTACAKLLTLHGYNAPFNNNPTGIKFFGGALIDSCVSYQNFDQTSGVFGGTLTNNSNYLGFCDGSVVADAFVVDCISGLNSAYGTASTGVGFKIKHWGTSRIHFHRCVSFDANNAFDLGSDWSSIRFCLGIANQNTPNGICVGIGGASGTDASNQNGALIDASTLIATGQNVVTQFGASGPAESGQFSSATTPLYLRLNTVGTSGTPSLTYPGQSYVIDLYPFSALPADGPQNIFMVNNTFYGTDTTKVMLYPTTVGTTNTGSRSLTQVNGLTGCSSNTFGGTVPTLTFQAAWYDWTYSAGTLSGVPY